MSKGFASSGRLAFIAVLVVLGFGCISWKLVRLHVIDRDVYLRNVERARRQIAVEPARRGDIRDSHDSLLATSRTVLVVGVDPQMIRSNDALLQSKDEKIRRKAELLRAKDEKNWPALAALLGRPLPELEKIFRTTTRLVAAPAAIKPASAAAGAPVSASAVIKFSLGATADSPAPAADPDSDLAPAYAVALTSANAPAEELAPDREDADDTLLADETDAPAAALERKIKWAKLAENISEADYARVLALGIRGIVGDRVFRRDYPHKGLAAHIVGFVTKQGAPATGIERHADFFLRGRDGWREGERDGRGREAAQFRTREVPRADGFGVTLSLDSAVQDIVEEELGVLAQKYLPLKATIIVSDARTGFVLGLANYPSFDLNGYSRVPAAQLAAMKNVALTDAYEPGSVFKIVAASAALEEKLVTPATTFDCSLDRIEYRGKVRRLSKEDHRFLTPTAVPLTQVISYSSNRGAAQLAMRLGEEKFYAYARAFGFGQRTGLPCGHETPGYMPSPEKWDGLTITRMPMGHAVSVTVMQMHQAMSVIAAGGVLLQPQIIRAVRDTAGETVYRYGPVQERRVISTQTAATMARLLMGCASTEGTAPEAAIPGWEVAGKTGTTQKLLPVTDARGRTKLAYSEKHHVASFVGFFPASDPRLVISVIVDDADARAPLGVAYGSKVAAPAFKRIAEQLIRQLDLPRPGEPLPVARTLLASLEGGRR